MEFKVTEGIVAALMLTGLDEPPAPEGFSRDSLNSYFAQDGVDVSLVWIGEDLHARMMEQHRSNLAKPQQVTVERIGEVALGGVPVTEVVYYKSRPVPDPDNPEVVVQGREATWQYIWSGDDGQSHALLTIWRAGIDEISALEAGFGEMRDRWQAGAALPGVLYDLRSTVTEERLVLTGVAVAAPPVAWGEIRVPTFHGHDDWAVTIAPWNDGTVSVTEPITLVVPGLAEAKGLQAELDVVERWIAEWSPMLDKMQMHVDAAGAAFSTAVEADSQDADLSGGLSLFGAGMTFEGDALELRFVAERPDQNTHEGAVRIDAQGQVLSTTVDW